MFASALTACKEYAFVRALAKSPLAEKVRSAVLLQLEPRLPKPPRKLRMLRICVEEDVGCEVLQEDLLAWDLALQSESQEYKELRETGCLDMPNLHRLPNGAFRAFRQRFAASVSPDHLPAVSPSQVKMPLVFEGHLAEELLKMCKK